MRAIGSGNEFFSTLVNAFRAVGKILSSGRLLLSFLVASLRAPRSNLMLFILLAVVGTVETFAREWSDPIQLTHHDGEWMTSTNADVLIDSDGYIHLQYFLERAGGQQGNFKTYHTVCNRSGDIVIGPVLLDAVINNLYFTKICETSEGNIAMVATYPDHVFNFLTIDDSCNYVIEPIPIDILSNPWWGDRLTFHDDYQSLKRTSNGGFVYMFSGLATYNDLPVSVITYTRLSAEGEGIDSVHLVDWFDRVGRPPTEKGGLRKVWFDIDQDDNLYFVYDISIRDVWTTRITKISPNDEVVYFDVRTMPFIEACESYMALDFTLDNDGDLYVPIIDMVDSTYLHLQKLNPDLEIVSDIGIDVINLLSNLAEIAIQGDRGGMIYGGSRNPDKPWNAAMFVSFSTTSDTLDSTEYVIGTGFEYVTWFEGEFYSIFYSSPGNGANAHFKMVKGTVPNSVENSSPEIPQLLSLSSYPNPFNNGTIITYTQLGLGNARFLIFDYSGRNLREITAQSISGSAMQIYWDGRDSEGNLLPSGSYFLRVNQPDERRAM